MVMESGNGNKVGRVSKRRSRNSNKKNQRSSLTKIKIEDHKEFPPLNDSFKPSMIAEGKKHHEGLAQMADQPHLLDATAAPFQSVYSKSTVMESDTAGNVHGIVNQREQDDGHPPGKSFELPEPSNLRMEDLWLSGQFIHEQLKQAVIEHRDLQQARCRFQTPERLSDDFTSLGPLEQRSGIIANKCNTVYLVRHNRTAKTLVVRSIHHLHSRNLLAIAIANQWRELRHPNIVHLWSITTAYQSICSILFAYEYHLGARTLEEFCRKTAFNEATVWSFSIQLVNGLRAVHKAGLAAKLLCPRRVLVTGVDNCTVRINCAAIADVIEVAEKSNAMLGRFCDGQKYAVAEDQRTDLKQLGEVIQSMVDLLPHHPAMRSEHIVQFAKSLTSGKIQSIDDAMEAIGTRVYSELATVQMHKDVLEGEILKEMDNGRLLRLLMVVSKVLRECRVNGVHGVASGAPLVHHFGDLLFSTTSWFDYVSVLNKLDIGSNEKAIPLNENSYLTYKDLKDIFMQLYEFSCCCPSTYYPVSVQPDLVASQGIGHSLVNRPLVDIPSCQAICAQKMLQQKVDQLPNQFAL